MALDRRFPQRGAGKPARLQVRILDGETITVAARLLFHDDGALAGLDVPIAPGGADRRERAARDLVRRLALDLAHPRQPSLAQLQREWELMGDLIEQLQALEQQHGRVVARGQRAGAA